MNKLTRILTMGGFGLLAALATGAGPANASPAGTASPENKASVSRAEWRFGDQTVGYYRSLRQCELTGQFGERSGDWDDHACTLVSLGLRRGAWALQVASDDDWNRGGFGVPFRSIHGFPSRFRPVWAGQFRGHDDHGHGNGGNHGHGNGGDHDGGHNGGGHNGGDHGGGHNGGGHNGGGHN